MYDFIEAIRLHNEEILRTIDKYSISSRILNAYTQVEIVDACPFVHVCVG